ncbi:DUF11 domain-containing protein [Paenibacillus sp. FJAT-26967]|uniref:DUF7507 domain-containing protein n=1 Tax=Paenibacillus sp. FJAT-26967 TaxID=1729690 RepID=UPI000838EAE3|nr:DUF11 domain-containing protein [Paenibacillus sp. FJAT-26967]
MAFLQRYATNRTGAITFTGNTLGLSRSDTVGVPGTIDSIGAYITTNTAAQFGSYPAGTTNLFTSNSSSAVLNLPAGSTVLYAELIWGGTYVDLTVDNSAFINNPITLTTPAGTSSVTQDPLTVYNVVLTANTVLAYVRTANVTSLVAAGGAGTYTARGIVGTLTVPDPTSNHAGWTLAVVYDNPALPFRNLSFNVGAELVQSTSGPVNVVISGFATPAQGTLRGRALISAQEGDANRTGDQALFGPSNSTLQALSGPNNFAANFFASQINKDDGTLDTSGTFGTRNAINGAPGTLINAGRQGWDITNVDISATLRNSQTTGILRLTTSGDAYLVNATAIQIDINAPLVTVTKTANVTGAIVGDPITFTVAVQNTGLVDAGSTVFTDAIPAGTTLVANSVTVNGTVRTGADPSTGILLGTVGAGSTTTVVFRVTVTSLPSPAQISNLATASFSFQSVPGGPVISGSVPSNTVTIPVYQPVISLAKSASTSSATIGDTVTYTVTLTNSGSIRAAATFTDAIPAGSSFVAGSVTVRGVSQPAANPAAGFSIGNLDAGGGSAIVTFQTVVSAIPSGGRLLNQAAASYTYTPPDGRTLSGSAASNTTSIPVSAPNVTVTKTASSTVAVVGDTVIYRITAVNNGIAAVTNVVVTDPIPAGSVLAAGSVTVNGTAVPAANPAAGVPVGTIAAGASAVVTFSVNVTSLPSPAQLTDQATVSFTSGAFTGSSLSGTITLPVFQPIISAAKSVNTPSATVGATLTYTVTVRNTGNIAVNATVSEKIPAGSAFLPGSVTVNGVNQPAANPSTGIPIGVIAASGTSVLTFQTVVNTVPASGRLTDQAAVSYTYQPPDGRTLSGSAQSNEIVVTVSAPNVTVAKSASATAAAVGDTVVYTLTATNNGGAPVTGVVISDPIPAGTSLIAGSVTLNGSVIANANPAAGVPAGPIAAGASAVLLFSVRVNELPAAPSTLVNQAAVSFTAGTFTGSSSSNTVTIPVYQPILQAVKSADTTAATVGDSITYTIRITNSGNYNGSATLTEAIPAGSEFAGNSVTVNGLPLAGADPRTGITVGTVSPGGTSTVTFVTVVSSVPNPAQLIDQAAIAFTYTLPDGRTLAGSALSNALSVPVSAPNVAVVKSTPLADAVVGDTVTYTIVVTNNGISPINNILVNDPIPAGSVFNPGSVTVRGAPVPGANPAAGITVGSLGPGAAAAVTFSVNVIGLPSPPQLSNQATASYSSGAFSGTTHSDTLTLPVYQPIVTAVKTANTTRVTVGDTVTYTILATNTGNLAAALTITDAIPAGSSFLSNSVTVGGSPVPGADPAAGIAAGTLAAGASVEVTFQTAAATLPAPAFLTNRAQASYSYQPPDGRLLNGSVLSNTVTLPVSLPSVTLLKSSLAADAVPGDTVSYSVTISNSGSSPITNVVLTDPIPDGSLFIPGSVTAGGITVPAANPVLGITLGTVAAGGSATVTFSVRVTSLPSPPQLANQASLSFTSGSFSGSAASNTLVIPVYQPVITASKSTSDPIGTVGDLVTYTIVLQNSGNIGATTTLTDPIAGGSAFVPNSVIVNQVPMPGASPAEGVAGGFLAPGASTTMTFQVVITSVPTPPQLVDQAAVSYTFQPPDGRTINGSASSNTVVIPVSSPNVTASKSASRTDAVVGDTITYSIVASNNGIENVTNVIVTDAIPDGTTLVPGSVTVNSIPVNSSPAAGIPAGLIVPGGAAAVTFSVIVQSLPAGQNLVNRASVGFTSGALSFSSLSNTVTIPVYQSILGIAKSASTSNATLGDTVTYTLQLVNSGNIPASATVTDLVPAGSVFTPNSVTINGAPLAGADPAAGIPVGAVTPGSPVTVTFQTVITSIPPSSLLLDQATADFEFTPPDGRTITGTAASNPLAIPVSAPNVTVTLATASTDAVLGDIVSYTITATNNGIENVTGVLATDSIPAGSVFIPGTVILNGAPLPSADPAIGVPVGIIAPGASAVLTFQTRVTTLPSPPVLDSRAIVSFTSGAFTGSSLSNTVLVPVYQPLLSALKTADYSNATVGDTVSYSISITNNGNINANLTITDPVPDGSVFVPNSVLLNAVPLPGADPAAGFSGGILAPGGTATVSFQTVVTTVPPSSRLTDQASVAFSFQPPDGRIIQESVLSNTLSIPVSAPNVNVTKTASAANAVVGDTITYTITATNSGIENVTNVVISDPIPAGSALVPGSPTLNGTVIPLGNPAAGIPAGTIAPGTSAVLSFQVTVTALPSPPQLLDQATVSFTSGAFTGSSVSPPLLIRVYQPILSLVKSGNSTHASVGDTITYSIEAVNSGNIAALTVISDPIPSGTAFFENSVVVNGTAFPGSNPAAGIAVGTLLPGASALVTFQVIVTSVPVPASLTNQAAANFSFIPPDGRTVTGSAVSNTVTIPVSAPNVTVVKTANAPDASVGDVITYTITALNNGITNVTGVIVTDPIPAGSTFVPGSVLLNGSPLPAANPVNGVPAGTIAPGAVATVSFRITVTSLPAPPQLSNQARVSFTSGAFSGSSFSDTLVLPLYQAILNLTKSANSKNATIGDTIVYTVLVENTGNIAATTSLSDPIPAGSDFVPNSVNINGIPVPGASPAAGIALGPIAPGAVSAVTFQVMATSLPSPAVLSNQAAAAFTFQHPDGRILSGSAVSNVVTIPVSAPNVSASKSVSAADAVFGDVLTYTIVAANNGIEPVANVIVTDPIPAGTAFVPGSVTINGAPSPISNPASGVSVGVIAPGSSTAVTFQVSVTSLPVPPLLVNQAAVSFTSGVFSGTSYSEQISIPVYQPLLQLAKSANTASATVGDTLTYTIQAANTGNIAAQVILTDPIPAGSEFIANSVIVSGAPLPGANPAAGINAGTIQPGSTATLVFQALVTSVPIPQQLTDQASAVFTFQPPDGRTVSGSAVSNTVTIPVSSPNVTLIKGTTAADAIIGDILTYSVAVTNSGIAAVTNVVVSDPIPAGSSFVPGSVTTSGTSVPGANPASGIAIGTLAPGATTVVTFQVTVQSLPVPAQLLNQASAAFTSGPFTFTSASNTVAVPVYQPLLVLTKTGSSDNATVGDIITYTITVNNSGNLSASTIVTDPIPPGSAFLANSVALGGVPVPGADPVTGVSTGPIAPGTSAVVTFQVLVTSVPAPPLLLDTADAAYTFVTPGGRTGSGAGFSNTVAVAVSDVPVTAVKQASLTSAVMNDIIVYTVEITNNDSEAIQDVVLTDELQPEAVFTPGSVLINGADVPEANPASGIPVGTLEPGESVLISFSAAVAALPAPPVLTNSAAVSFVSGTVPGTIFSNTVGIPVLQPIITLDKQGDTSNISLGEQVTYTLTASNSGSTGAFVTVTDQLPEGSTFVADSVTVNGTTIPGLNPAAGITVGTLTPGSSTIISFRTIVSSEPADGNIANQASAAYAFQTPDGRTHGGAAVSNPVIIPVTDHSVSAVKVSTASAAALGDSVPYGITLTNSGQSAATSVTIRDLLPDGTGFVAGSVTINGLPAPDLHPQSGITLGEVPPQSSVQVGYTLTVTAIPASGSVVNTAEVSFVYGGNPYTIASNTVTVPVYAYGVEVSKRTDTSLATVGSIVAYTVSIINRGTVIAESLLLRDALPAGTELQPGSLRVNGNLNPAADLAQGVLLPPLNPEASASVTYSLAVVSLPPSGEIENQAEVSGSYRTPNGEIETEWSRSNVSLLQTLAPVLSVGKSASAGSYTVGDAVEYTLVIRNTGTLPADLAIQDPLPPGTAWVLGSLRVNGESRADANPSSLALGSLEPGQSITAAFRLKITALPPGGILYNRAVVRYTYQLPNQETIYPAAIASNEVSLRVYSSTVQIDLQVDSSEAARGDQLTFTVTIVNTSGLPITRAFLKDILPEGFTFLPGSIRINGLPVPGADLIEGFLLGEIAAGASITITFIVLVIGSPGSLESNRVLLLFDVLLPDGRTVSAEQLSNPVNVRIVSHEE